MTEWQDISSAPRDGTWVLVWVPDNGWHSYDERDGESHPNITLARYTAQYLQSTDWYSAETYTEFWDYGGMTGAGTSTYQVRCSPTKWMPLPLPPTESNQ